MSKLYRLNIDEFLSSMPFFTEYDIGGEGHSIVVEEEHLNDAIAEIVENFSELVASFFEEENPEALE